MEMQNNSTNRFIQEIREKSEDDAASIIQMANTEAQQILDDAKEKAEANHTDLMKKAEDKASVLRKKIISGAVLEMKSHELRNREKVINRIFKNLSEQLNTLRTKNAYADILKFLIKEGAVALETESIILSAGSYEKKLLTKDVLQKIQQDVNTKNQLQVSFSISDKELSEGGVMLESGDGRMVYDNRFSARIHRMNNQMRLVVIQKLIHKE